MSDDSRLDALELAVARLTRELVSLRSEVRRRSASLPEEDVAAPRDDHTPRAPIGVEGRGALDERPSDPRTEPYISDELRRIAKGVSFGQAGSGGTRSDHSGTPGAHDARAAAARATNWGSSRGDLERLVGRYGTLALAALTILMGVGAFLGWAVRQGLIGPELRVALGAVAAAVVAVLGWRLRRSRSGRFGDILLALALAIVHVDCWGAGPLLGLVPDAVSLGVAAVASAALATLSLREEDQSLFNVGFGGALLAPFVTSSGGGAPLLVLVYGAVVLYAAMHALRDREWSKTPFVMMLGIATYAAATTVELHRDASWPRATAPGIFAVGVSWLALLLVRGAPRSRVAHVAQVAALCALLPIQQEASTAWPRVILAFLTTLTAYATSTPEEPGWRRTLLGAFAIPLGAVGIALLTLTDVTTPRGAAIASAWALAASWAAMTDRDRERGTHAFTASFLGALAIALYLGDDTRWWAAGVAAYCAILALLLSRLRLGGVAVAAGLWLSASAMAAFTLLDERVAYEYRPFLSDASAIAAVVAFAWMVFSWNASRLAMKEGDEATLRMLVRILGGVVAFLWIRAELAEAFSPDASTFLLIAYYALIGVVAIGMGRWRAIPLLRQLGLALSVYAAFKAIMQASAMAIGWRVGGYLLAGAFLLGVAYWYRANAAMGEARES